MKTHLLTLYWFKQICLRAPLALMGQHFGANLQSGGGGGRRPPPGHGFNLVVAPYAMHSCYSKHVQWLHNPWSPTIGKNNKNGSSRIQPTAFVAPAWATAVTSAFLWYPTQG